MLKLLLLCCICCDEQRCATGKKIAIGTKIVAAAVKKTDCPVLRAAVTKKTVVAAKKNAADTRARKLAVVKKKAAKRMTESAKRNLLRRHRLENKSKKFATRMTNDNIAGDDLLLKAFTDAEIKRKVEPLGKITHESLVYM